MGDKKTSGAFYTASDMARLCDVDLKTIHNWVDREKIKAFRTPGRHLRFERDVAHEFLRAYGYPVPAETTTSQPPPVPRERHHPADIEPGTSEAIYHWGGLAHKLESVVEALTFAEAEDLRDRTTEELVEALRRVIGGTVPPIPGHLAFKRSQILRSTDLKGQTATEYERLPSDARARWASFGHDLSIEAGWIPERGTQRLAEILGCPPRIVDIIGAARALADELKSVRADLQKIAADRARELAEEVSRG